MRYWRPVTALIAALLAYIYFLTLPAPIPAPIRKLPPMPPNPCRVKVRAHGKRVATGSHPHGCQQLGKWIHVSMDLAPVPSSVSLTARQLLEMEADEERPCP